MIVIASRTVAQNPPPSLFQSVRPEAMIVLRKHSTGADLVEVSVVAPDYPAEVLQTSAERVGSLTGTPVRGLALSQTNGFLRVSFATNGLIGNSADPEGRFHLVPLIRAFGFAKVPIRSLAVLYESQPADRTTIRRYRNDQDTLRIEAQRLPGGVEYRTWIAPSLSESQVTLPGGRGVTPAPAIEPSRRTDWTLPAAIGGGAAAAGLLVYLLVPRGRRRIPAPKTKVGPRLP